jgi:hypothetical protein
MQGSNAEEIQNLVFKHAAAHTSRLNVKVGFRRHWQPRQVRRRADLAWAHARVVETPAIVRHVRVGVLDQDLELAVLETNHFFACSAGVVPEAPGRVEMLTQSGFQWNRPARIAK